LNTVGGGPLDVDPHVRLVPVWEVIVSLLVYIYEFLVWGQTKRSLILQTRPPHMHPQPG
jgi:hypothetical protein